MSLRKLISKLKYCDSPQSLLQLEDQFNNVGLTVQLAASGKLFLCLIEDGKPVHEKLLEDHIQYRILRDNSNTSGRFSGADQYGAAVGVLSFDSHFQINSLGSTDEYTK